jgi:hypothetical protein
MGWGKKLRRAVRSRPKSYAAHYLLNKAVMETLEARVLLSTVTTAADDLTDDGQDGHSLSLRMAIAQANATGGSETINFDPAVFNSPQTINLIYGALEMSATGITIAGPGAGMLTVNAQGQSNVFTIDSGSQTEIDGLTISGGSSFQGGGIYNSGNLTIHDSTISGNTATAKGGGIQSTAGSYLSIYDSTISGNTAAYSGGGVYNCGVLTASQSNVTGNAAGEGGGGIGNGAYCGATLTISECTITGNSSEFGGGIYNQGYTSSPLTVTDCTITGNTAGFGVGGGIYLLGGYAQLTGNLLAGNSGDLCTQSGGQFGGIDNLISDGSGGLSTNYGNIVGGTLIVGTTQDVDTTGVGSGLDSGPAPGQLSLRQAIDFANIEGGDQTIQFDGSLFNNGAATIDLSYGSVNLDDTSGTITIGGPGASSLSITGNGFTVASGTSANIEDLTITNCTWSGISNYGNDLDIERCVISNNSGLYGGVLSWGGTTTITNSTISGNTAHFGGGIYSDSSAALNVIDSTISGNTAVLGGGIYGTATIIDSTIANNRATTGGGVYTIAPSTINGSIVALNSGGDLAGPGSFSGTYNLIGDGSGGLSQLAASHNRGTPSPDYS